jgi:transcription elongation factor GreB
MSKAFTKEDDASGGEEFDEFDAELEDEADDSEDDKKIGKFRGTKNYITTGGLVKLKSELHELLVVERPKVVETVAWAASNGDRSENADYQYGKKRLREIDRRVRFLQKRIDIAEVVEPQNQKGDKVLFGATVKVLDESEKEHVYRIVGVDETDARTGKISWISPIGQALLQARVGDQVTLKTPRGEEDLEILEIRFIEIEP